MNSSSETPSPLPLPKTTSSMVLNSCKRDQENIKRLAEWIVENPWVDEAKLYTVFPGLAQITFEPLSKALLVEHFGASGWKVDFNDACKIVDGIKFSLRRETVTISGEIPEEEMLKA